AGDRQLPGGNVLPSPSVERLRGEAHAVLEWRPVERRRAESARPAHADELLPVAHQQRGDGGAIEAFADRLEPPDAVPHRLDQRSTGVEYHREDMLGVAAAVDGFVGGGSQPFADCALRPPAEMSDETV